MSLSSPLLLLLQAQYGLGRVRQVQRLQGGEWNDVWRLDTDRGVFVLRYSHPTSTLESVRYEHRLLRFLSARIPQVPAPLVSREGNTHGLYAGRVVTLFPFLHGTLADRESETLRLNAARMLALLHREALDFPQVGPRPGYPCLQELDWDHNPMWDRSRVQALLRQNPPVLTGQISDAESQVSACITAIFARREQIEQECKAFQIWIQELAASGRPLIRGVVHGDYYRANLLTEQDRITGVLDWDECRLEWLAWELGRAIWEFCKDKATHTLRYEPALRFRRAYEEAAGPVPPGEFDLLLPFIRCVRLTEALWDLDRAAQGQTWSPEYTLHNLIALENLKHAPTLTAEFSPTHSPQT